MQNFKAIVFSVVVLAVVSILGYWAVVTIEPGNINIEREKQQALAEQNEELQNEVADLKERLALYETEPVEEAETSPVPEETPFPVPSTTQPSKYDTLISELQKLVDEKVYMKEKSRGTRVGTIQTFLNIYNKTTKRVDNDYGASTKADIANFQKAVGLSADGQSGPSTYQKMIDWLKANS